MRDDQQDRIPLRIVCSAGHWQRRERDAVSEGWWTTTIAEWSPSPPVRLPRALLRRVAPAVLGVVGHPVVRGVLARAARGLLSRPATARLPAHRPREIERGTS